MSFMNPEKKTNDEKKKKHIHSGENGTNGIYAFLRLTDIF